MPCPFPGMDPYLEASELWPDFHGQLAASLYHSIISSLDDGLRARVAHRHYATQMTLFTSVTWEEQSEPFIEVRTRSEENLVATVDIVSLANRTTTQGRAAFLADRQSAGRLGVNLVAIDLLRGGQAPVSFDQTDSAEAYATVTVTRAAHPARHEIYTAGLDKPLPRFRLPLLGGQRDLPVDLQAAFSRAYDQGHFDQRINYAEKPLVPLDEARETWLQDLLKRQDRR